MENKTPTIEELLLRIERLESRTLDSQVRLQKLDGMDVFW